ncbi:MAG: PhoU domain-containing protein [Acidimicrobiales bacterium]
MSELIPWGTQVLLNGDMGEARSSSTPTTRSIICRSRSRNRSTRSWSCRRRSASDLRHLTTILKSVGELERSADLVVNICKATRRMYGSPMSPKIRGVIDGMSQEARRLIQLAMEAFADADSALAAALSDIDDELDNLNREMVEAVFAAHHDGAIDLAAAVQLALVARYYERIGDHAVNIGERVGYMVTGWLPELNGSLRTQHRGQSADPVVANPGDGPADGG